MGRLLEPISKLSKQHHDAELDQRDLTMILAACGLTDSCRPWRFTIRTIFIPLPSRVLPWPHRRPSRGKTHSMGLSRSSMLPCSGSALANYVSTSRSHYC